PKWSEYPEISGQTSRNPHLSNPCRLCCMPGPANYAPSREIRLDRRPLRPLALQVVAQPSPGRSVLSPLTVREVDMICAPQTGTLVCAAVLAVLFQASTP